MARSFTNAANYLNSSSITQLTVTAGGAGTVFFWIQPNWNSGDGVDHGFVFYRNSSLSNIILGFQKFSDNNFYIGLLEAGGIGDERVVFADTGIITSGKWYNFTYTYTIGGNGEAFINAVSKGTHAASAFISGNPLDELNIGVNSTFVSTANASIAMIATWNVALTAGELSALNLGARPETIRPLALIANYPIDGLQSPEPDLSGKAKNLTMTGTAPLAAGPPVMQFTPRWNQFNTVTAVTVFPYPPFQLKAA